MRGGALDKRTCICGLAKGIPTGIKYTYSNLQYAPEDMGSRSGVHDEWVRGRGTLIKSYDCIIPVTGQSRVAVRLLIRAI